jgi:hypothetical protein
MSNPILDGDGQLGADGVLQGWCWNAKKPADRQIVEILINERIVASIVASRFREDLRQRYIGDGYYGFVATITKSLAEAGNNFAITARERTSGCCFWRQIRGQTALPTDFADRLMNVQNRFSLVAWSREVAMLDAESTASNIPKALCELGATLQRREAQHLPPIARARAALLQRTVTAIAPIIRHPRVAIIFISDSISHDAISALSAVISALNSMDASLLLIDRGSNAEVSLCPSLFRNLRYIFNAQRGLRALLADALQYSHGDYLVFLRNPDASLARGLPEVVARLRESGSVYLNSGSFEIASKLCAEPPAQPARQSALLPIGLTFAGRRDAFERISGLLQPEDEVTTCPDIDFAIRALRDALEVCVWDERLESASNYAI